MNQVRAIGNIKDGVFSLVDRDDFKNQVKLKMKDGIVDLILKPQEKEKSRPLEKYYWSVVLVYQCNYHKVFLSDGETPDTDLMHEMNLYRWARTLTRTINGKEITVYKRTSSKKGESLRMFSREQYEFVERVKAEEAIMGLYIPDPCENIEPNQGEENLNILDENLNLQKEN